MFIHSFIPAYIRLVAISITIVTKYIKIRQSEKNWHISIFQAAECLTGNIIPGAVAASP